MIKAVIFDWGGVLIDDPAPGMIEYIGNTLGVGGEAYSKISAKYIGEFQRGEISENEFWTKVCADLNVAMPTAESLWAEAFEKNYKPKHEVFDLVMHLRNKGYRLGVLSNTEQPAMEFFHKQNYALFDAEMFSCDLGVEKPQKQVYQIAIKQLAVKPSQAVLIDDKEINLYYGNRAWLNTILFQNPQQIKDELKKLGVKID